MIRFCARLCAVVFLMLATPAAAGQKTLDVQAFKTPAGIDVWLVADKSIPVLSMNFSFEGGLAHDPAEKPGVARLVSILLDEGAGSIKSQEFQTRLTDHAIEMSFTAGRDAFFGQLRTLTQHRAMAADLLRLALLEPRFDEDAIVRMKNANAAQIQHDMGDPSWLVARSFNGMLFEGHHYALPGYGHLASMKSITRKDLTDFTKAQFGRDVLKIAIAGDITAPDAAAMVDKIFGSLPDKAAPSDGVNTTPEYKGKTILYPLDTPQTFLSIGAEGIARTDKDWHAAVVMNYILGGNSFDARLMKEIREKRGLTYGIYSSLQSMRYAALLFVSFSTSNEKAAEALTVLREQWTDMATKGPTTAELQDAKDYLTGSLMLELTSTGDIAGVLNGLQRDGLDAEYINRRNAALRAVTLADVKRVATRLLKAEDLTTVMVGKPKDIKVDILLDRPPGMTLPDNK